MFEARRARSRSIPHLQFAGRLAALILMAGGLAPGSGGATAQPPVQAPGHAPLPVFAIDATHSHLGFKITHLGFTTVRGRFGSWTGAIAYGGPDALERASVTIVVDVATIDTGNEMRDNDLRSANFFDVEHHPVAYFQSTAVSAVAGGIEVRGVLSMHGVERELTIPFRSIGELDQGTSHRIGFAGEITLARADFGVVNEGNLLETSGVIGKEATLELEVAAFHRNWSAVPFSQYSSLPSAGDAFLARVEDEGRDGALAWAEAVIEDPPAEMRTATGEFLIAAARLAERGDVAAALDLLQLLARARPDDANVRLSLAEALRRAGRADEAEEIYRAIVSSGGTLPNAVAIESLRQLRGETSRPSMDDVSREAAAGPR
jgi:polyisoprenoid-binding protein YceI